MTAIGAFCLAFLVSSVLFPLHPCFLSQASHNEPVFVTLDVCHTGPSALSGSADMPSLCGAAGATSILECCGFSSVTNLSCSPLITAFRKDRPPRS